MVGVWVIGVEVAVLVGVLPGAVEVLVGGLALEVAVGVLATGVKDPTAMLPGTKETWRAVPF
jgi:hypothetical protein